MFGDPMRSNLITAANDMKRYLHVVLNTDI